MKKEQNKNENQFKTKKYNKKSNEIQECIKNKIDNFFYLYVIYIYLLYITFIYCFMMI